MLLIFFLLIRYCWGFDLDWNTKAFCQSQKRRSQLSQSLSQSTREGDEDNPKRRRVSQE